MKIIRHPDHLPYFTEGCAVTIGNFDGVHRGHAYLLKELATQATKRKLPVVVVTFEPQPREVLSPEQAPPRLASFHDKCVLLEQQPVDYLLCLPFNAEMAAMSAEAFVQSILIDKLNTKYLLIGDDFRFGSKRQGDFELLKKMGQENNFIVNSLNDLQENNMRISSTVIREALQRADLDYAQQLLGHPYFITGHVQRGAGLGRQWGFPTANIAIPPSGLPLNGVFTVSVSGNDFINHPGVANVGIRPTVDGTRMLLEVLLLDFTGDLYGESLRIEFLHKLRDEKRFTSTDLLIKQIEQDVIAARRWFNQT